MVPLDKNAVAELRVNGKKLVDMKPVQLKPNDRICIGDNALFLFKNIKHEDQASRPDTPENPITFDVADQEVYENEQAEEAGEASKLKTQLNAKVEESQQQAITDLQKNMDSQEKVV